MNRTSRAFHAPLARAHRAFATVAVLVAASLVWLAGTPAVPAATAATAGHAARPAIATLAAGHPLRVSPATGASNVADLGTGGWRVASSADATQSGAQISTPGFDTGSWLPVSNDGAGAPGTEIEALLQNGRCPGDHALQPVSQSNAGPRSVVFSDNMRKCFGYENRIGADTVPLFSVPWWWRTDFTPNLTGGQHASLIVNGVIGSANVWVNEHQVATSATVTGAYTRFGFDITGLVRPGTNSLAVEVNPNDPNSMFTLDDVDWNQIPPDNNTGIEFPVQLAVDNALTASNGHVLQDDSADLSRSTLTVQTDITNSTGVPQSGTVDAGVTFPSGHAGIGAASQVTVPAHSTKTVTLGGLTIHHPQIWWPYQLGGQPLYHLTISVTQHGRTLNSTSETFGIRTVTSYLTGSSAGMPAGARAFKINGVPIVIRGGGWSPNMFLHYSAADTAKQIALMKNMGVNTIRLEGHIMPADFFQQMDRAGILVNAGYQCCDGWQLQDSALTIGQNLRNHPSVFSMQWSDDPPIARQEAESLAAFRQAGWQVPVISSAENSSSPKLGVAGEKEGPYDWVPPNYWYDTTHPDPHDSTQTNSGGAWGYDSEESAGDTVPTLDSLHRFMSAQELSNLWRNRLYNQYHANYEPRCNIGYSFGTLCHFDTALLARYGQWSGLSQYVEEAQALNYEDTRAQFEAFIDKSGNKPLPATGTIYWQMNKGFPSLLWNLYGSDGDQAGAYFGTQEANRSLHALYALDNGTVTLDNLGGRTQSGLSVQATVYSLAGQVLGNSTASGITLGSQQVRTGVLTPKVPAGSPTRVYFVELQLRQHGTLVDRNVYWLSTHKDVTNWTKSDDMPQGIISQYARLKALQTLPASSVAVTASTARRTGPDGADLATTVTITDTSRARVAFLLRADVRRGTASGHLEPGDNELQSSIWQANDITLFPGQSQTLTVTYDSADLHGATPVITVSGWNVPQTTVAAPVR